MGAPVILQTYPRGLLGWLRQRIGGGAPDQVATILQPTIDAGRLYRDLRNDRQAVTFDPLLNTTTTGWTVPSNQRWEIMTLTAQVDVPNLAAIVFAITARTPTGEEFQLTAPAVFTNNSGINRVFGISAVVPTGLILDPGFSIGTSSYQGATAGGPYVGVLTASWYAMEI